MRKINRIRDFVPTYKKGHTDLLFDKTGLTAINANPNDWILNKDRTTLTHRTDKTKVLMVKCLCGFKLGEVVNFSYSDAVVISEIKLMRLDEMTNEIAIRTGIEQVSEGKWKHYSPEKFYPKEVLKNEPAGSPYYNTAVGSFHSLWCRKYEVMEIYANPYIWIYTCKKETE